MTGKKEDESYRRCLMHIENASLLHIQNVINQFTTITDDQMKTIGSMLSSASYKKHEYFIKAGDLNSHAMFILSGLFRVFYINYKGTEYTKNFGTQNQFMAPFNSILRGKPSNLYIQALEDSEVLLLDYNKCIKTAESNISLQIILRKIMEEAYLQKEKRESDLLFYDAETRYINFKKEFPNLLSQIKQHHIASFLGMSPETLSRIKRNID
jgi:CRP-like cAMP-binding protein